MRNPRIILDYLVDIRNQIDLIARFLADVDSPDALNQDPKTAYAVTRAFEVIGEATKNLPQVSFARSMGPPLTRIGQQHGTGCWPAMGPPLCQIRHRGGTSAPVQAPRIANTSVRKATVCPAASGGIAPLPSACRNASLVLSALECRKRRT